jgi:hypothetical protein
VGVGGGGGRTTGELGISHEHWVLDFSDMMDKSSLDVAGVEPETIRT